ncbi:hypothetical protein GGR03_003537 [Aurantimonas endophytica]|uniref:Uncharacterized protein n=1 Tax=Aurantimonas endophytica TaxID=1522175 RepID=A0A7W6HFV2_9HYPH|nr:hypothetical protein [Aurantimonas endophytica]
MSLHAKLLVMETDTRRERTIERSERPTNELAGRGGAISIGEIADEIVRRLRKADGENPSASPRVAENEKKSGAGANRGCGKRENSDHAATPADGDFTCRKASLVRCMS